MGRRGEPIRVIVYMPTTPEGQEELAKRVAQVHADAVIRRIKKLNCPEKQKHELLDAVIADARARLESKKEIPSPASPEQDKMDLAV